MEKICSKCGISQSIEEFRLLRKDTYKRRANCSTCERKRSKERYRTHPYSKDAVREKNLKNNRNITITEYNSIFYLQSGRCAICGIDQSKLKKMLSVDHNHTTGENRGLLCNNCNTSLGLLKEDISVLKSMINYIKKYEITAKKKK